MEKLCVECNKRETWEETNQNIGVEQVVRYQVYPNDISVYTSKDFTFTGKVAIGGEFAWIRKVSKGKIKPILKTNPLPLKTCLLKSFTQ